MASPLEQLRAAIAHMKGEKLAAKFSEEGLKKLVDQGFENEEDLKTITRESLITMGLKLARVDALVGKDSAGTCLINAGSGNASGPEKHHRCPSYDNCRHLCNGMVHVNGAVRVALAILVSRGSEAGLLLVMSPHPDCLCLGQTIAVSAVRLACSGNPVQFIVQCFLVSLTM
jgi:hypothetical protein